MHDGKIQIQGFDADGCMCREVQIHAMLWAIGELQREIQATIEIAGGSGNASMDLPVEVNEALRLPDPLSE